MTVFETRLKDAKKQKHTTTWKPLVRTHVCTLSRVEMLETMLSSCSEYGRELSSARRLDWVNYICVWLSPDRWSDDLRAEEIRRSSRREDRMTFLRGDARTHITETTRRKRRHTRYFDRDGTAATGRNKTERTDRNGTERYCTARHGTARRSYRAKENTTNTPRAPRECRVTGWRYKRGFISR